jgi:hypothetical protein
MPSHRRAFAFAGLALATAACSSMGQFLQEAFRERPPSAIDRLTTASDARLDSIGRLAGSFVGEGTSRAVHLVSSDTALIGELVRRYSPRRAADPWAALQQARILRIPIRTEKEPPERGPIVQYARIGSPDGRSGVLATALLVRAGRCGTRGAQMELVVEDAGSGAGPDLRGPVVGSLVTSGRFDGFERRDPPPEPSDGLIRALVDRTRRAIDSTLAGRFRSAQARPIPEGRLEVNTLADIDAAEVIAYDVDAERVRYAVSLRERRVAANGDTLIAVGVMAWDSTGIWQQTVFRPTYLRVRRGSLTAYESGRPFYWRRLGAVADFGFRRDNLWMEQVDVRDGTVLWGIVQPSDNVVVAAAEMAGPCR